MTVSWPWSAAARNASWRFAPLPGPLGERVAAIEANLANLSRRVDGQGGNLFGTQGNGGLNGETQKLTAELRHHIQEEAKSADRTATVLVGEAGDGGLVGAQAVARKDLDRLLLYSKAALFVLSVIVGDVLRRLVAWLVAR